MTKRRKGIYQTFHDNASAIHEVARRYRKGNRVEWKQAVADDPKLESILIPKGDGNTLALSQWYREQLKKGSPARRIEQPAELTVARVEPSNGHGLTPEQRAHVLNSISTQELRMLVASLEMNFCSKCGKHLAPQMMASIIDRQEHVNAA